MSDKFQNQFRIPSARAQWWDYGWNALYFVTICTANRECYFGEIKNGNSVETGHCPVSNDYDGNDRDTGHCPVSTNVMQLSEIGQLAEKFWWSIPEHFPFVKLDAFVVMPNHIHGILIIDKQNDGRDIDGIDVVTRHCLVSDDNDMVDRIGNEIETGHCPVSTKGDEPKMPGELRFRNQGKHTLSSIIGSYKSIVTKHAHSVHADFEWQERFHDHIIRDRDEFYGIASYIENNVANWHHDKFYE